jgi:5'-3' exonuclease
MTWSMNRSGNQSNIIYPSNVQRQKRVLWQQILFIPFLEKTAVIPLQKKLTAWSL